MLQAIDMDSGSLSELQPIQGPPPLGDYIADTMALLDDVRSPNDVGSALGDLAGLNTAVPNALNAQPSLALSGEQMVAPTQTNGTSNSLGQPKSSDVTPAQEPQLLNLLDWTMPPMGGRMDPSF